MIEEKEIKRIAHIVLPSGTIEITLVQKQECFFIKSGYRYSPYCYDTSIEGCIEKIEGISDNERAEAIKIIGSV